MRELFFELYPHDITIWLLRLAIMPLLFIVITWVTHIIWGIFEEKEMPSPIRRRLTLNKSLVLTVVLLNIYWFFIVRLNGWDMFYWESFNFELRNVYFALVPLLLTYGILIYWFYENNNRLKNQL